MSVLMTVDTTPPANPTLVINGGATSTASLSAVASIASPDHLAGANDVTHMRIWGDVDLLADVSIQQFEEDSAWITIASTKAITLSAGTGRKRIYARLRDSVGNVSIVFGSYVDYDPLLPQVSMVVEPLVSKVSLMSGHDETVFSWDCNVAFVEYQVRSVPTSATPRTGGSPIASTNGSINVAASGSFAADTPIQTTVKTADLVVASPGDSAKIIKVFVRDSAGRWSP